MAEVNYENLVASAIRTLAHAVAIRQKQNVDIEFSADEESSN